MTHIETPEDKRLVWYLAMEEYIGQHIFRYAGGAFFTWVVSPTVIFGRHQQMSAEVNTDYCAANGIQVFRRKSGGGCVYADRGNLMLSYVVPSTHAEQVFQQYLNTVAKVLNTLDLDAVTTEHNDILVDGRKVSGNACYAMKDCTIVHGTMLYDVDFTQLTQAITPSGEKLIKHGLKSVRQRVRNLKPLLKETPDIGHLASYLIQHITKSVTALSNDDCAAIDRIEQTYLNPEFIHRL